MSARSRVCESIETISSTVSAPCASASSTWYSSTRKSFRRQAGRRAPSSRAHFCVRTRTSRRSSKEPLNHLGSVRTDRTLAPNLVYSRACAAASKSALMSPLDGEARLNSAARARPQAESSAALRHSARACGPPCSAAKALAWSSSSGAPRLAFASATSFTRCSTISCSFVFLEAGSPYPYRCPQSSASSIGGGGPMGGALGEVRRRWLRWQGLA
mmetsp:Transcript_116139/g.339630  ORF Transcript_116139/g.339630 Transcript_116139/m.339630 type:complete len:215 (-) Transcript_116139:3-647(-)